MSRRPDPDLTDTERDLEVPAAVLTKTRILYSRPPTPEEAAYAEERGICAVCDVSTRGCWCRWCGTCSRFYMAIKSTARTPGGDHHGIKVERCPTCMAAAGRSA